MTITVEGAAVALAAVEAGRRVAEHRVGKLNSDEVYAVEERLMSYYLSGEDYGMVNASTPVEVTLGSLTEEVTFSVEHWGSQSILLHGACATFAVFARRLLNVPYVVFTAEGATEENWFGHAGLLIGDNLVLDAKGIRSFDEVTRAYKIPDVPDSIRVFDDEEEFLTFMEAPSTNVDDFITSFDELESLWLQHIVKDLLVKTLPLITA